MRLLSNLRYDFQVMSKKLATRKVVTNFLYAGDGSKQSGIDFVAQSLIPHFMSDLRYSVLHKSKIPLYLKLLLEIVPFSRFFIESAIRTIHKNHLFVNFNYFTPYRFLKGKGQDITIIHDMLWYDIELDDYPVKQIWMKRQLERTIKKAHLVVCVSDFTKSRIEAHFPEFSDKLKVVPNPVDSSRFEGGEYSRRTAIGFRYFLCISSNFAHKNVSVVKMAFSSVFKDSEVKLVLVGPRVRQESRENPSDEDMSILELGFVSDQELGNLIHNCEALISPSIYEGFGLTNFEALLLGKKILASNIPTVPDHPSITKIDDFQNVDSWAESLNRFWINLQYAQPSEIYINRDYKSETIKECYDKIVFKQ